MTAIAFRFLSGRYHATPWERHANEGVVEWPPSPWRILRALVAASYRMEPRPSAEDVEALAQILGSPPVYQVPPGALAHTRHYMPTDDRPTLVFDTFVAVAGGAGDESAELVVIWPDAMLSETQEVLLDRLLSHIGYLGRSESWVEAKRVAWTGGANVRLDENEEASARERIRIKALLPLHAYEEWKVTAPTSGKRSRLPNGILEILQQDSGVLQKQGWSEPPGTQWLVYRRPSALLEVRHAPKPATRVRANLARYAVQSAVLPLLTDAIRVAERMRSALVRHADGRGDLAMRVFSGHDQDGAALTGNRHAYYLPVDDDQDGRIDHLLVWAPAEFDTGAREALASVKRLWGREGHDLHLALIGTGVAEDYSIDEGGWRTVGPASVWESRTPFVLPRHPKFRRGAWIDTPEDQLRRFLGEFDLMPERVEPIDATSNRGRRLEWFRFRRTRGEGHGRKALDHGYGFRLHFPEPVGGPIAVGYGAHMGLGQFSAVE